MIRAAKPWGSPMMLVDQLFNLNRSLTKLQSSAGHTHILLLLVISLTLFLFLTPAQATLLFLPVFIIFLWLSWVLWKDWRKPVTTGIEGMIGHKAQVVNRTRNGAKVLLRGELWDAVCGDDLSVGETVQVTGLERMKLVVCKDINSRGM